MFLLVFSECYKMYLFKRPIVALFFQCLNSQCAFESLYQCKIHKIITYFTADFYNHHNTNSGIAHRAAAALQQMPTTWPPRSMCSVCVHNATHGFDNGFVHVYNGRSSAQKAAVASRLTFVFSNVGLLWLASCCHLEAVEIHTDIRRQWISIALINTGNTGGPCNLRILGEMKIRVLQNREFQGPLYLGLNVP